jgi:hypothetical protein
VFGTVATRQNPIARTVSYTQQLLGCQDLNVPTRGFVQATDLKRQLTLINLIRLKFPVVLGRYVAAIADDLTPHAFNSGTVTLIPNRELQYLSPIGASNNPRSCPPCAHYSALVRESNVRSRAVCSK